MPSRQTWWLGRPAIAWSANRIAPALRLDRAGDDVEQRRLAGAVGTDDGADLAFLDPHGDLVERDQRAVASCHAVELEQRHGQGLPPARHGRGARQPPDSLGREQDEGDEDQAEVERPGLRQRAELVLHQHEEGGAQDRADQRSGSADDHHDEHLARQQPEQQLGIGEAGERRVEGAGQPAQPVGDRPPRRSCRDGCCSRAPSSSPRSRECRAAPRRTASAPGRGTRGSRRPGRRAPDSRSRSCSTAPRSRTGRSCGECPPARPSRPSPRSI